MISYPFGIEDPFKGLFVEPGDFYKTMTADSNIRAENISYPTVTIYPIVVDYRRTVKEMIRAGKYSDTHDIAPRNYPVPQEKIGRVLNYKMGPFFLNTRPIKSRQVLNGFKKIGAIPSQLPELLALGEQHPELQNQFPIVALEAVEHCFIREWVVFLGGCRVARGLYTTSCYFQRWDDMPWRFAAILPENFLISGEKLIKAFHSSR